VSAASRLSSTTRIFRACAGYETFCDRFSIRDFCLRRSDRQPHYELAAGARSVTARFHTPTRAASPARARATAQRLARPLPARGLSRLAKTSKITAASSLKKYQYRYRGSQRRPRSPPELLAIGFVLQDRVLGRIDEKIGEDLRQAHEVCLEPHGMLRQVDRERVMFLRLKLAGQFRSRSQSPSQLMGLFFSSSVLRVMRETSRRSSSKRLMCVICRSMTSSARFLCSGVLPAFLFAASV